MTFQINYRDEHVDAIPLLAAWHYETWSAVTMISEGSQVSSIRWLARVPTKPSAVAEHVLRDPRREIGELQLLGPASVPFEAALL